MPLGAHMSVAGGLDLAPVRGRAVGCEVAQIFTKNSNQWAAKPLAPGEVERFKRAQAETGVPVLMAHDSYLINLCAEGEPLARSEAAFREELERCEALGIPYLVTHPGAHLGAGEEEGLRRMAAVLDRVHAATRGFRSKVLLENTAGQGSCVGYRFEHLKRLFDLVREPERLGVCLDTCHTFAAGYDLRTPDGYRRVMDEFDHVLGLERLKAFHLNDSKKGLGCRVDRHEHIGRGEIGIEAFRALLNDPRLEDRPMVIETEKGEEGGVDLDVINLTTLRRLRGETVPDPVPVAAPAKKVATRQPAVKKPAAKAAAKAAGKPPAKLGVGKAAAKPPAKKALPAAAKKPPVPPRGGRRAAPPAGRSR
jgi:deoxyribonuclease-4